MGVSHGKPEDHFKNREEVDTGKRKENMKRRKDREYRTGKAYIEEQRQKALRGEE